MTPRTHRSCYAGGWLMAAAPLVLLKLLLWTMPHGVTAGYAVKPRNAATSAFPPANEKSSAGWEETQGDIVPEEGEHESSESDPSKPEVVNTYAGAIIADAPTSKSYKFSGELESLCRRGRIEAAVQRLPLSYTYGVNPRDFLITGEFEPNTSTALTHYWTRTDDYWAKVKPLLAPTKMDVFGTTQQFDSCAIVGNSGNLLKSAYGREIDRHQRVFRFNLAPAGGVFEEYVGSKTHFRMLNNKQSRTMAHDGVVHPELEQASPVEELPLEKDVALIISRLKVEWMEERLRLLRSSLNKDSIRRTQKLVLADRRFIHYSSDVVNEFRRCKEAHLRCQLPDDGSASSGMAAVLNALHLCKHVTTYGIGEQDSKYLREHFHYYKDHDLKVPAYVEAAMAKEQHIAYNGFGHKNTVAHHFDLEAEMLQSFARVGYIRHCTAKGCRGKELPWPAQSLLQPVSILEYEGARIQHAPTPETFDFSEELKAKCHQRNFPEAVAMLPLSLPLGMDPQSFVLTKESDLNFLKVDEGMVPIWPWLKARMAYNKQDIFGSPAPYNTCAVVGNSAGLLQSVYGREIDSHDAVFRFELAPAGGEYAAHVGNTTHFRILKNQAGMTMSLNGHTREKGGYLEEVPWERNATLILYKLRIRELETRMEHFQKTMAADPVKQTQRVTIMDKRHLVYATGVLDAFRACEAVRSPDPRRPFGRHATSVLSTSLAAMHLCKHITVYGFAEEPSSYVTQHVQYYPSKESVLPLEMQQPADERSLVMALADAGFIRHCTWEGCRGKAMRRYSTPPA